MERLSVKHPALARRTRQAAKLAYWTLRGRLVRELRRASNARKSGRRGPSARERALLARIWKTPTNPAKPSDTLYSPTISIILPTYNTAEQYLEDVLKSVRAQTYGKWELCIVDDASTEERVKTALRDAMAQDSRIRVEFAEKNTGIGGSSQRALDMATGDYVAFLDHDDMLTPGALSAVVEKLRQDPSVDMVYSDHAMMDQRGRMISGAMKPDWSPEFFLTTNYIVHLKVIRRSMVEEVGGFAGTLPVTQDLGLSFKLLRAGAKFAHVPEMLYCWRVHTGSVASNSRAKPKIAEEACKTIDAYLAERAPGVHAVWPDKFRRGGVGVYKLEFPEKLPFKIVLVVPLWGEQIGALFLDSLRRYGIDKQLEVHLIGMGITPAGPAGTRMDHAKDQAQFDSVIAGIDAEILVFASGKSNFANPDWLRELVGYFLISPQIGVVGGKVLDEHLVIEDGAKSAYPKIETLFRRENDIDEGYWYTNLIASNVDAVSAGFMATRKDLYAAAGGLPLFELGFLASVPYCLNLRAEGYRTVFNPWAKVITEHVEESRDEGADQLFVKLGGTRLGEHSLHLPGAVF